jgi:hypothetical protein
MKGDAYKRYNEAMSEMFKKYGAFFAFSQQQIEEGREEGVEYVSLGSGLVCPAHFAEKVLQEIDSLHAEYVKSDIEENGRKGIIWRELENHEAQITRSIDDTVDALESHGIGRDEVDAEYKAFFSYCVENDLF